jgi:hypothetical protein
MTRTVTLAPLLALLLVFTIGAVQATEPKRGSYSGAMPAVADSVDADFPTRFAAHVAASGGYGATRFAPAFRPDRVAS